MTFVNGVSKCGHFYQFSLKIWQIVLKNNPKKSFVGFKAPPLFCYQVVKFHLEKNTNILQQKGLVA